MKKLFLILTILAIPPFISAQTDDDDLDRAVRAVHANLELYRQAARAEIASRKASVAKVGGIGPMVGGQSYKQGPGLVKPQSAQPYPARQGGLGPIIRRPVNIGGVGSSAGQRRILINERKCLLKEYRIVGGLGATEYDLQCSADVPFGAEILAQNN